ncbi:MAG: glycosyltransferase family 4 protein [bacterium]|nr:glycosyltransferase family 4 protein [bacterium]
MKKPILIFATTYFPLVGGAEIAMKEITNRLPDFEFHLVCAKIKRGLQSSEKIGNVHVHRVGFGFPIDKYLLPFFGPLFSFYSFRSSRPNAVWSLMASYGGFAGLVYSSIFRQTHFILTLQEGDPLEHYKARVGRLSFLHKAIFKRANTVQAISRFLAKWSKDMGFQGEPVVIPNGVDTSLFMNEIQAEDRKRIREEWKIREHENVLITTSRLSLKNGIDDVIRALSLLPVSWKFVILGDGEDRAMLERLANELGVWERVRFLGLCAHSDLPLFLQSADVFIRPSLSEGLGNSFLEAMSVGLPVIGTPVGGIPDFLLDGQTGLFCEVRNPDSIVRAVQRLEDSTLREQIIQNGKSLVHQKYDWDQIAQQMKGLLEECVNSDNVEKEGDLERP